MKPSLRRAVVALVTALPSAGLPLILLAGGLVGCHRPPAAAPVTTPLPVAQVRVGVVAAHTLPVTEEVMGTVRSRRRALVGAKATGRIEALEAVPGRKVAAGEWLAQVEAGELRLRVEQAAAVRDQASRDLQRLTRLIKEGAAAPTELDAAQARNGVAVAAFAEAEAAVAQARITAPFAGVITRRLAEVGDLATPGRPLFEMEDPTDLRFEADVPEALLERVTAGARLEVRLGASTNLLSGIVSEVAPAAESASRTFLVKLDLPAAPGLRAGVFGRMSVPVGTGEVLHVPLDAVVRRGQLEFVMVATNRQAQLRLVRTGRRYGADWELLSGVRPGESVVIEGARDLLDGQPLEVRP
jgi:membrane fusion protein (multidrug efflux system)